MKIYNTTTGKEVNLEIIDRRSGLEWTADLIGNAGDLHHDREREMAVMSQEDYEWWANTIDGLNEIEDLIEEAKEVLSEEEIEDMEDWIRENGNANDYEVHIATLTRHLRAVVDAECWINDDEQVIYRADDYYNNIGTLTGFFETPAEAVESLEHQTPDGPNEGNFGQVTAFKVKKAAVRGVDFSDTKAMLSEDIWGNGEVIWNNYFGR